MDYIQSLINGSLIALQTSIKMIWDNPRQHKTKHLEKHYKPRFDNN